MAIDVHLVHAFVDGGGGGNPAGVVLEADGLDAAARASVARAVGLSETAFVSRSAVAGLKLQFFTPTRQIAHCGHATVATYSLCRDVGRLGTGPHAFESADGVVEVDVAPEAVFLHLEAPVFSPLLPGDPWRARALAAIGADETQLQPGAVPGVMRAGNAFLVLPLQGEGVLARLVPDAAGIEAVSESLDLVGFYPFMRLAEREGRHAAARMFAPRFGIPEESATGTAGGLLAGYLDDVLGWALPAYGIEQGACMVPPSPSLIHAARLDGPEGRRGVRVGGAARVVGMRRVEV